MIDPRISMGVQVPKASQAINIYNNTLANNESIARSKQQRQQSAELFPLQKALFENRVDTLPLQNQLMKSNVDQSNIANDTAQRNFELSDIAQFSEAVVMPLLQQGNVEDLQQRLTQRRQRLISEGKNTETTDEALNMLMQGDYNGLAQGAASYVDAARRYGGATKGVSTKSYAPITDPDSGQMSIPTYNPNTGETSLVPVEGAKSLTPKQEMQNAVRKGLLEDAGEMSKDAFKQLIAVDKGVGTINEAIKAIDGGAQTGVIANMLPSFTESTIALENAANRMGLDVVASTTFGALSEGELKLAMTTAVPLSLPPKELKSWLIDKRKAQKKLARELKKMAIELGKGKVTPAEYLEKVGHSSAIGWDEL
jgi:hypothetical protein